MKCGKWQRGDIHTHEDLSVYYPAVVSSEMVGWDCHWRTKGDVTIPRGVVHFAGGTKCDWEGVLRENAEARALMKERCEWVGKGLRHCKSHPNREREAVSRHWGTPPRAVTAEAFAP